MCSHRVGLGVFLANVRDEPRPWLARRVRRVDLESGGSFDYSCDSTRRDGHGRWLWRIVRLVFYLERREFRGASTPPSQDLPQAIRERQEPCSPRTVILGNKCASASSWVEAGTIVAAATPTYNGEPRRAPSWKKSGVSWHLSFLASPAIVSAGRRPLSKRLA
jgi:hypothetical protein